MMAVDVKQLSEAVVIDLSRCEAKADKVMAARRLERELLAAANLDVVGDRQWFALRTMGISEIELCQRLVDSRVDAVVPVKQVPLRRRWKAQTRALIHKPVLSGLVFANLVPSDGAFAGLLRVKGVAALIGTEGRPYAIGSREMNGFMDLAQAGAFDERNTPTGLAVGSKVKIKVGSYADFQGILDGYAKGRTARVMTWLFGREMTIDVKLAHLEKFE